MFESSERFNRENALPVQGREAKAHVLPPVLTEERTVSHVELRTFSPASPEATLHRITLSQKKSTQPPSRWFENSVKKFVAAGDWMANRLDKAVQPIMHMWPARLAVASLVLIGGALLMFSPIPGGMVLIPIGLALPFGIVPGKSWSAMKTVGYFSWRHVLKPMGRFLFGKRHAY